jgi:hypothetical protein
MFDYIESFRSAVAALKRERRYRNFADLEQISCNKTEAPRGS